MIQKIHTTIAEELGRHVQHSELEAIKQIWNKRSVRGVAGHTAKHEHEEYDWSGTTDLRLQEYMKRLTETGATKMWDGWFTKYWTPIIQDMIRRRKPNTKQSHSYDIARKAAYQIRITIKQNLYEIWKIRNQIKHEPREETTWTKAQVENMIVKLRRKLGRNTIQSVEELMKKRKRKLNQWMERAQEDLDNREQEEQERREAIRQWGKYSTFTTQHTKPTTPKYTSRNTTQNTQTR